jgi:hypothetical protein
MTSGPIRLYVLSEWRWLGASYEKALEKADQQANVL